MEDALAETPRAHPFIPGTGEIRKARWELDGKGKREGVRVIHYAKNG